MMLTCLALAALYFGWRWLSRRHAAQRLIQSTETPLPAQWREFLADFIPYGFLSPMEKRRFDGKFRYFLEDKHFHGVNGFVVEESMRLLVAAEACLMITNLTGGVFPALKNIYLTEDDFVPKDNPVDPLTGLPAFEVRTGEAWHDGPLIFSWRAISEGESVIYHEFAHHLDQGDGGFDGTPELGDEGRYQEWQDVLGEEFIRLKEALARGEETYIDEYAATNEAEFFAVLSEYFFTEPRDLIHHHPRLYQVLKGYYRLDSLAWDSGPSASDWPGR